MFALSVNAFFNTVNGFSSFNTPLGAVGGVGSGGGGLGGGGLGGGGQGGGLGVWEVVWVGSAACVVSAVSVRAERLSMPA